MHHYLCQIFHVHVVMEGKGVKEIGLKNVGY
jgi:hypothetical protein